MRQTWDGPFTAHEAVDLTRRRGGTEKDAESAFGKSKAERARRKRSGGPGCGADGFPARKANKSSTRGTMLSQPPSKRHPDTLRVESPEFDGAGHAVQGQHVGGDPIV